MFDKLTQRLDFHGTALQLRAERQRIIAGNIANADTPGYGARDFKFADALNAATQSGPSLEQSWAPTAPAIHNTFPCPLAAVRQQAPPWLRPANATSLDKTRWTWTANANFVDNAVRFEATLRFINGNVRTMLQFHPGSVRPSARKRVVRMSMFSIFNVSGSAISAQSQRT